MLVAIIGDVHSNIDALYGAMRVVRKRRCDKIIFIGDLLTYGPAPNECLQEILNISKTYDVSICLGNHDYAYNELISGRMDYYNKLPVWIRESFDWTLSKIDISLWNQLAFKWSFCMGDAYLAHANPYGENSWQYLNTLEEYSVALDALSAMNKKIGLFGHTHRRRIYAQDMAGRGFNNDMNISSDTCENLIVNVGSIGQPRGENLSAICWMSMVDNKFNSINFELFDYDVNENISRINQLQITDSCKSKLLSFFIN